MAKPPGVRHQRFRLNDEQFFPRKAESRGALKRAIPQEKGRHQSGAVFPPSLRGAPLHLLEMLWRQQQSFMPLNGFGVCFGHPYTIFDGTNPITL